MLYIVITWPDVQELMDKEGFKEHSYLVNDEKGRRFWLFCIFCRY